MTLENFARPQNRALKRNGWQARVQHVSPYNWLNTSVISHIPKSW